MAYVVTPSDRESFKRCRRAWDLGSPRRRNYEPVERPASGGLDRAVRDALAVWYFPGMWEWDRSIVRPLAFTRFTESMEAHRAALPDEDGEWHEELARGRRLLEEYLDWAQTIDEFTPIRVETDFSVRVPDPRRPDHDLAAPGGEPIQFEGRIDLLVARGDDSYWMVQHRTVATEWAGRHDLLLEERATSFCWAWEQFFLGMRIAGVVYNELKSPPWDEAALEASPVREETPFARRTWVPRSRAELAAAGARLADEALEMVDPGTAVYPNPSPPTCATCVFQAPCQAVNADLDAASTLVAAYRRRAPEQLREGRLGGITWSMNRGAAPPRFGGGQRPGG